MMKQAPFLSEHLDDIQALLTVGFGTLTTSRFWLLTIRDGREEQARAWLSALARSSLLVRAEHFDDRKNSDRAHIDEAVAVAFSFAGLAKLGIVETDRHPFPTPFRDGMGSKLREALLRDGPRTHWRWSDAEGVAGRHTAHVLVVQLRLPGQEWRIKDPDPDAFCTITVEDRPRSFRKGNLYEPFGFRDGIAQPEIRGLRDDLPAKPHADPLYEDRVVAPGEFVLGYVNEYDELTYCPDVQGWTGSSRGKGDRFALNGSYLAVRQIEQNVKAFRALEKANPRFGGRTIGEKLMGRRKKGWPLSWNRGGGKDSDAFRYGVEDANGFMCPKGAHIRRVNPRDSLGVDVPSGTKASKLHRLLRRGRPYLEETGSEQAREGMFFIACNADLERQFEFIHQRWVRNFHFGNLRKEDDPIVGSSTLPKTFTVPGLPTGDEVSLAAFTQTLGGGYFFLPGIKALEFIAGHRGRSAPSDTD